MEREALAALEREVEELRIRAAEKRVHADSLAHSPPWKHEAEMSTLVLALSVLVVFVAGRAIGIAHASVQSCAPVPANAYASITLEREQCFGDCPAYRVTIDTDGAMTWQGQTDVVTKGSVNRTVDAKAVRDLAREMSTSCFFDMRSRYDSIHYHEARARMTLRVGDRVHTVMHTPADDQRGGYGSCLAPRALVSLERRIDEIAGTKALIGP